MLTHDAVLWQYVSCCINAEVAEHDVAPCTRCRCTTARSSTCSSPRHLSIGSENHITATPTPDKRCP